MRQNRLVIPDDGVSRGYITVSPVLRIASLARRINVSSVRDVENVCMGRCGVLDIISLIIS